MQQYYFSKYIHVGLFKHFTA